MKNIFIAFALVLFTACSSDDAPKDYTAENDQEIQTYIADNNLSAQESNSGLYYIIEEQGTGFQPKITDRVKVAYKGYLTDGTVFEENQEGVSFASLQGLIPGWSEGITYFNEGGEGKLIIPSDLAYGNKRNGQIPPGAVVIFDIKLIYVNYITENDEQIQAYLSENEIITQKTNSGLYYFTDGLGEGTQPTTENNVTVNYTGYYTTGGVFDRGPENVSFDLDSVIEGFSEGLTYFKEGDSGTLFIPSHLGYGNTGISAIPGGAVLIFDIKLISIN